MVWVGYMLHSLLRSRAYIMYVLCFLCLRRENQSYPQENVIGFEMRSREGMGRIEFFSKRRQSKEKRYSSHLSNSQLFSIVETNVGSVLSSHVWLLRQFSNFFSRMNWDHLVNFYFAWVTFHYLPGWLGQCWKCCSCFDRRMLNSDGLGLFKFMRC